MDRHQKEGKTINIKYTLLPSLALILCVGAGAAFIVPNNAISHRHVATTCDFVGLQQPHRFPSHAKRRHVHQQLRPTQQGNKRRNGRTTTATTMIASSAALAAFVDVPSALTLVGAFYKSAPFASAFLTCGMKASAADIIAQAREQKTQEEDDEVKEQDLTGSTRGRFRMSKSGAVAIDSSEAFDRRINIQRNIAFFLYGGLYQGMGLEYIYNSLFPMWFGRGTGLGTVLSKVLFNMCVLAPLVTLPVAYLTKSLIFRHPLMEGLRRYWNDIRHNGLLLKFWSIWGPVMALTFSVVPEHLRITFIAFFSFFWMVVFSSISNSGDTSEENASECRLVDATTCRTDG